MEPLVAMISCEPRHAARARTLPQLRAAGLEPRLFLDDCAPRPERPETGNKWIAAEALRWAEGRDLLIVEDDIDPAPDFPAALELARASGGVAYLYVHDEPERMRALYGAKRAERLLSGKPTPLEATPARTVTGLFGAQCVLVPARCVPLVLESIGRVRKAVDAALQDAITRHRLSACVVTPHAVQHRHDRTCRTPESYPKRSLSFGVPRGGIMPP